MANEWEVVIDRQEGNKRFVEIRDTVNDRSYSNFFPIGTSDGAVKTRFVNQVKEHRAEINKSFTTLNLDAFEAGL